VIARRIRSALQERIVLLERNRDRPDGCIGCSCLSLDRCRLYNPGDRAAKAGPGPRYLVGDVPLGTQHRVSRE
jgi:MerR family redox-sensitive transcriptional activator SoxR